MTTADTILIAIIMLLGEENVDYIVHKRSAEEWHLVKWIHRN
jgi:hypothetical protein